MYTVGFSGKSNLNKIDSIGAPGVMGPVAGKEIESLRPQVITHL